MNTVATLLNLLVSSFCRSFDIPNVGTRVVREDDFMECLQKALLTYEFPENGKGVVPMTDVSIEKKVPHPCTNILDKPGSTYEVTVQALETVSCGEARRADLKPEDMVEREHRGETLQFARRSCAAPLKELKAVVYTLEAYITDPDVPKEEQDRVKEQDATHVLVTVLGSCGADSTVSEHRFERNLESGQYSDLTPEELEALRQKVVEYNRDWITVAD
jgi:hypothetical protein